jgi:uroporphyrinogen III methyltransferase / synthase
VTGRLDGPRVVVTRAKEQSDELVSKLEAMGCRVLLVPTIAIYDPHSWEELDRALREVAAGAYEWVVFASSNSVAKVVERASGIQIFEGIKIAAVGPRTAAALDEFGLSADVVPVRFESRALAEAVGKGRGRLLLPRVAGGPRSIVDALEGLGWSVDEVEAYRNLVAGAESADWNEVRAGRFDIVTFTSPSTVRNLLSTATASELGIEPESDGSRAVVCIGPTTAAEAEALGVRVDRVAADHSVAGVVDAVNALKGGTIGA